MTLTNLAVQYALVFYPNDDDYSAQLDRLYKLKLRNPVTRKLVDARMKAIIHNDDDPDIVGEFFQAGGTEEEFKEIVRESSDLLLTPGQLRGAIDRIRNGEIADEIEDKLEEFRVGNITLDDISTMFLDTEPTEKTDMWIEEAVDFVRNSKMARKIPTGFRIFDSMLGGLPRTQVTILGARPGVGKSDIALQICRSVAKRNMKVLLATLEMDMHQVIGRMSRAERGMDNLNQFKRRIKIDVEEAPSVGQIASMVNRGDYDLVIVDHLQLISSVRKYNGRYERMTDISGELRIAAKRSNAAWLVLSQLSRNARDEHSRPLLSDLRDSGAIEENAYAVCFLHQPAPEVDEDTKNRSMELTIAKNRGGPLGIISYSFIPSVSQWDEI